MELLRNPGPESMEGINDFLTSATTVRSPSQQSVSSKNNFLASLTQKESPSPDLLRKPSILTSQSHHVTSPSLINSSSFSDPQIR